MWHILKADSVNHKLPELFQEAEALRGIKDGIDLGLCQMKPTGCENKVMATLFFEPSTRTRLSFETAMHRLGGKVISATDSQNLSLAKGESQFETLQTVSMMADIIVVRGFKSEEWNENVIRRVPIINAGGRYNHPTQALLDAYTLWRHYLSIGRQSKYLVYPEGSMKHLVVGDLGNSRTIHSYISLMKSRFDHEFYIYDATGRNNAVPGMTPNTHIIQLTNKDEVEKCLPDMDVVYLNRVQKERHAAGTEFNTMPVFEMTERHLDRMKPTALVLNPGPCQEELPSSLFDHPKVKVNEQVENGVYVRMALLRQVLTGEFYAYR